MTEQPIEYCKRPVHGNLVRQKKRLQICLSHWHIIRPLGTSLGGCSSKHLRQWSQVRLDFLPHPSPLHRRRRRVLDGNSNRRRLHVDVFWFLGFYSSLGNPPHSRLRKSKVEGTRSMALLSKVLSGKQRQGGAGGNQKMYAASGRKSHRIMTLWTPDHVTTERGRYDESGSRERGAGAPHVV